MENIKESQQSETDTNTHISRSPLYTHWNPNSGSLEVVRGYRNTRTPEGKYYPRTWTEAPPEQHTVTYELTCYGSRRLQTMVHNPRRGLFELKHSPIPSPTVSPLRRLRGTAHATNKYPSLSGTATQTITKGLQSTSAKTIQITDSTSQKTSKITQIRKRYKLKTTKFLSNF